MELKKILQQSIEVGGTLAQQGVTSGWQITKYLWNNRALYKQKVEYLSGHPGLHQSGMYTLTVKKSGVSIGGFFGGVTIPLERIKKVYVQDHGSHANMMASAGGLLLLGPIGALMGAANRKKITILCIDFQDMDGQDRTIQIASEKAHNIASRLDSLVYKYK